MAYSYAFRVKAIARLAATQNDYEAVAKEMGVSERTLYRWNGKADPEMSDFLEEVVKEVLENIPNLRGKEYGIFVGILLDKLLLFKGEATERTETTSNNMGAASVIQSLDSKERAKLLEKALKILRESDED